MVGTATVATSSEPWFTRRTVMVDLAIAAVVIAPTVARPIVDDRPLTAVDLVAAVATVVLLVARRRWPLAALAVGLPTAVLLTVAAERPIGLLPAVVVLLFTVAVRFDRRTALIAGAATLAGFLLVIAVLAPLGLFGIELLVGLAWPMLAVAGGDVVRNRRQAREAAEERARQAEATREHEARRRVAEERLRIARELHDVVAHRIAVVNVQAGVAAHLVHSEPDEAQRALEVVRSSAGLVLDELSDILNVLRSCERGDGVHRDEPPVEPTPSLADLPALVESFAPAGLHVEWQTSGSPRSMSASVQLAVYRAVQEGLTNAHKHGDGSARLSIATDDVGVTVVIENGCRAAGALDGEIGPLDGRSGPGGHGLLGMRERVAATGGTLEAGPVGADRFRLTVRCPVGPNLGPDRAPECAGRWPDPSVRAT